MMKMKSSTERVTEEKIRNKDWKLGMMWEKADPQKRTYTHPLCTCNGLKRLSTPFSMETGAP
jgi:hypothetical protein